MSELRTQVDQAMAGAAFLDPEAADHDGVHYTNDRTTAIEAGIAGLITAVRILADHLDSQ